MRFRSAAIVFSALLGVIGALVTASPASASTSLKGWMLSQGDYNEFNSYYGKPIPVQWVTCAKSKCPDLPKKDVLIRETSYKTLVADITSGKVGPGDGVLADYETWNQTPPWQQKHPEKYICLTDMLAAENHFFLIQSPFNPSIKVRIKEEVAASSCAAMDGASEVTELQYQGREVDPADYKAKVKAAVDAIHAKVKGAPVIGGLATDLKFKNQKKLKAVPICKIIESYFATKTMLIGYWLNSSLSQDTAEGVRFFEDIGAITPHRNPHCTT
jgi:hypothetical protein